MFFFFIFFKFNFHCIFFCVFLFVLFSIVFFFFFVHFFLKFFPFFLFFLCFWSSFFGLSFFFSLTSHPHTHTTHTHTRTPCEGSGDVVGVLTLLVGGVAQTFHDDWVVELRVHLGVEEVEGKDREEQIQVEKGETSQRGCVMDDMEML